MRVMLQGYLQGANFGDILFAHMFYDKCKSLGFDVDFYQYKDYGIGDFCRKELGYTRHNSYLRNYKADALILISGGCLWDDRNRKGETRKRFYRYVLPARLYQMMGKPVYCLGVGGGPVDSRFLRYEIVKMLNNASVIQFRDEATCRVFEEYDVKNKITVTSDTAHIITSKMLKPLNEKSELDILSRGRKKILIHIPDGKPEDIKLLENVIPGVIRFLKKHKEYLVVLSNDNLREIWPWELKEINRIRLKFEEAGIERYDYKYHDSWQMCSLINEMDCVVTSKLHVGVIGVALGKSVVAFPVSREKTVNYYNHIGESERCIHIDKVNEDIVYSQLEKYHDLPVFLSDRFRIEAEKNLSVIENLLK